MLIEELAKRGAHLRVFDPEAMKKPRRHSPSGTKASPTAAGAMTLVKEPEGLILVTEWNEFREPDFERLRAVMKRPVVFDGRNIYNPEVLSRLGFAYFGVGRRA